MKADEPEREASGRKRDRMIAEAEKLRHEEFEKQWNGIYSQNWSDPGQTSTMLGAAGGFFPPKAEVAGASQIDEDGEVIAPTPMALPPNLR